MEAGWRLVLLQPELLPEHVAGPLPEWRTTPAPGNANGLSGQTFVGNRVGSNCSGDLNQGSFLIDYTVNRHLDLYAGVTFEDQTGGLNSGFLEDNLWAVVTWHAPEVVTERLKLNSQE